MSGAVVAMAATYEEFEKLATEMVVLQAFHGLRCQQHCPTMKLPKSIWRSHYVRGRPTPMMVVEHDGIPSKIARLEKIINEFNKHVGDARRQLAIGLYNGSASTVVGSPESLHWLYEKLAENLEKDEARVAYSDRTPRLVPQFLDVSVPFHGPLLAGVDEKIHQDALKHPFLETIRKLAGAKTDFRFPVYSTADGEAMKTFDLKKLLAMQTTQPLNWAKATEVLTSQPGYVLDMGPSSAVSRFTIFLHQGNGVVVVNTSLTEKKRGVYGTDILEEGKLARVPQTSSWVQRYAPRLDARGELDTKYTRLVGRPPVMVPGMTPWSHGKQVAAVSKAGYHAELAGGGIPLPHLFEKEVRELALQIPHGQGISVNLLYLNAYLWGFQFPMMEKLAAKGEPVESFTVAAGIPSFEKLVEFVDAAKRAKLRFIALKPGTAAAVRTVVDLCVKIPDFEFMIQWTGGRSGGHHSFEDQYEPLLETYALIRDQPNITLVVGGGLGDAQDAYEWMSGDWSLRFGRPRMPVDAVLMGSRVLATVESATGEGAKDFMLEAQGVGTEQGVWETSMRKGGEAGGVITVNSELGEPIHVVKNRCSELWREFDTKYFNLSPDDMVKALLKDKKKVIESLNKDFQKPWFGNVRGQPCELGDMTYYDVCLRLLELMYTNPGKKWIDVSYRVRLSEMLHRTEERFVAEHQEVLTLVNDDDLEKRPKELIEKVFDAYPRGRTALLLINDQDYFVGSVCLRADRKPVNFITQIDKNFKRVFKQDSLWQSENLHTVVDRDAARTFIIYGPVAARHVRRKDETLAELLDGVNDGVKALVKKATPPPAEPKDLERLVDLAVSNGVAVKVGKEIEYTVQSGCSVDAYRALLSEVNLEESAKAGRLVAGEGIEWIKAVFGDLVVRGDRRAPGPIKRVLLPLPGTHVALSATSIVVKQLDASGVPLAREPLIDLKFDGKADGSGLVTLHLSHQQSPFGSVPLELQYQFKPTTPSCPLHEPAKMRYEKSTEFYVTCWEDPSAPEAKPAGATRAQPSGPLRKAASWLASAASSERLALAANTEEPVGLQGGDVTETSFQLTRQKILDFCHSVGLEFRCYIDEPLPRLPMDFSIVAGWTGLISAVLKDERAGNVNWLELLHLENRFTELQVRHMKSDNELITSSFEVIEVSTTPSGKKIGVQGLIKHNGAPWVLLTTYFFVPTDIVSKTEEEADKGVLITNKRYMINCDEDMKSLLESKDFFRIKRALPTPCEIFVEVHSKDERRDGKLSIQAHGTLCLQQFGQRTEIGEVHYKPKEAKGNALLAFLERHAAVYPPYRALESPYTFLETPDVTKTPMCMKRYAKASGDYNPIHTDDMFARLAGLKQGPIVHGMWSSANARRVLAEHFGQEAQQVTDYKAEFVDTVPLGAQLVTQIKHVGMRGGQCVFEFESAKLEDGRVAIKGTADVRQPKTLFTFTGQGSQFQGMGKELREASESVAALWARADKHFTTKYGLSLLQIVNENPKEKIIYFGGCEGERIKASYMSLMRKTPSGEQVPVFPTINKDSTSFTFAHDQGLLFSTQFAQPALVVTEMSQYLDLKDKQLVPSDVMFAGHSLGEYAALSSVAEFLPLENLMDVVFMRGLTMQTFVERKADGSSDYAMVAVNPTRVGKKFTPAHLQHVVDQISTEAELCQIVNFNVEPLQYVCAGHVRALLVLRCVLDEVALTGANVEDALAKHKATAKFKKFEDLKGKATIPLKGIDVPFHSRMLRVGVDAFRAVLEGGIPEPLESAALLHNRYIPNLVAKPFSVSKEYFQLVHESCDSPILAKLLANWEAEKADKKKLSRTLLIELLAYQFASPVLWTKTVEEAICKARVTRMVELGPGPVLKGMLKNALAATPALFGKGPIENLHFVDSTDLTYAHADRGASATEWAAEQRGDTGAGEEGAEGEPAAEAAPAPVAVAAAPVAAAAPAVAASSGPDVDVPVRAIDALRLIVGSRVGDVPAGKTLKQLVGGKSAMQNELVGEFAQEFGSDPPDNGAELPLEELAKHWPGYNKLGKATTQLVNKVLLSKLPPGSNANAVRKSLEQEFAISAQTSEGILLRAVALAPAKKLSAAEAVAWRGQLVNKFNEETGAQVGARGAAGGAGAAAASGPVAAMDPKMAEKLKEFAKTISKAANDFLGPQAETVQPEFPPASPLEAEYGEKFKEGIKPLFFQEKVREYNDWWSVGQRRVRNSWSKCEDGLLDLASDEGRQAVHLAGLASTESLTPFLDWLYKMSKSGGAGQKFIDQVKAQLKKDPVYVETKGTTKPTVFVDEKGNIVNKEVFRGKDMAAYVDEVKGSSLMQIRRRGPLAEDPSAGVKGMTNPYPSVGPSGHLTSEDKELSDAYFGALNDVASNGLSLKGKVVLITGVSPGSIAEPITKMCLRAGATVLATTRGRTGFLRQIYQENCGEGARLIRVPFNQASRRDVINMIKFIYTDVKNHGLGLDVDFFFPFAASPENGRGIDAIDDVSELAHRIMLTHTILMCGLMYTQKKEKRIVAKQTIVFAPLSPNHGVFGFDGLYAESKLGLESLFHKWHAEKLQEYISIYGATIGWVRGTSLMASQNMVAPAMEALGCRTFTAHEMAFNFAGLMHPAMVKIVRSKPLQAILTGKMECIQDIAGVTGAARKELNRRSAALKNVNADLEMDRMVEVAGGVDKAVAEKAEQVVRPRPYMSISAGQLGKLPTEERRQQLQHLKGMVDPASTVVITGFAEVGPWGDSWTRWEMEKTGEFSVEGCVLMAWMLGYIKYFSGPRPAPKGPPVHYSGWVDSKSSNPVSHWAIKANYEKQILENCGMRVLDPAVLDGFDGSNTMMHHTVMIEEDLKAVEVDDMDIAKEFKRQHGDLCEIEETAAGVVTVRMKKGAKIYVPRALRSDRWVTSQVPSGWDPKRFDIPDDIINQTDRVTLYALVATAQALRESGVMDPYEFYEYVHLSHVGNTIGSGIGGITALKDMFVHRYHTDARRVKGDVLQETFINTTPAWVNMLIMSASGPIKTPVGACATAMESAAIAVDTILAGQAKVVLVGAVDDLSDTSIREFASMQATNSADADQLRDRLPSEMSRPMASTRAGFVESHGSGVCIMMSGDLALQMGAPIYGIVGMVHTATDHVGRSVPAPGQGILGSISESPSAAKSPLLDLETRRKLIEAEIKALKPSLGEVQALPEEEVKRLEALVRRRWSVDWWKTDPNMSPLRGALSTFGLTVDDITVASCHGTSTKLNDLNETEVVQKQMDALGRTPGNPLYLITQKWITGHPKGPAASWQMNGLMQAMMDRVIPGNRNLDCVDPKLRTRKSLFYTNETITKQHITAGLVNSFGFGQAGGQMLIVHPEFFLSSLETAEFARYSKTLEERWAHTFKARQDISGGRAPFVPIKSEQPHGDGNFGKAIVDKTIRRPRTTY
eukprot:TRINITY_DN10149_c0_g1_i3.p1 TRINITY_DN10149_c0_g1~~TRINITY_DN10149_c0_g1_i3.p1  ORF type:complete len:3547 (-),score=1103.08 TRINITY_DN10149_c0_g1_i3:264-10487(-)